MKTCVHVRCLAVFSELKILPTKVAVKVKTCMFSFMLEVVSFMR
jgi:hypothetical protein